MVLLQAERAVQGSMERPALLDVQLDYYKYVEAAQSSKRSPKYLKREQEKIITTTQDILISEIEKYASAGTTEYQQQEAQRRFDRKLSGVSMLDYPTPILQSIIDSVINYAISPEADRTSKARMAAARIVATIGHNADIDAASVKRIMANDKKILPAVEKNTRDSVLQDRHDAALEMLKGFGVKFYANDTPPIMRTIPQYINETASKAISIGKEHAKTVKAAGTIGVVAVSIMTPIAAQASAPVRSASSVSQSSSSANGGIDASPNSSSTTETTLGVTPVVDSDSAGISFGGSASVMGDTVSTPNTTALPSTSAEHQTTTTTAPSVIEDQPTLSFNAAPPTETQAPINTVPSLVESNSPAPVASESTGIPAVAAPAVETVATPSSPNQTPMTTDQINTQTITSKLANDGDIDYAVSFIGSSFTATETSTNTSTDTATEQAPVTPNAELLSNFQTIQSSYQDLLYANGHADVNYIHTTQMTIAVLEAMAKNPAVIQSKTVQGLVSGAVAPTDAYQLRLFNQYLDTAKLPANSDLIDGITDPNLQNRVQEMYAYVLMADTSDAKQAADIQTMKDADAQAAAEAAAKAAAIAQAQAEAKAAAEAAAQKAATPAPAPVAASSGDAAETALIQQVVAKHTDANGKYVGPHTSTAVFGNCTDGASDIEALIGNPLPGHLGDGKQYGPILQNDGYPADSGPEVGDVASTATFTRPGNTAGHVGVVESKNPDGSFVLLEMNHSKFDGFDTRTVSADDAKQFDFTEPKKP